MKIPVANQLAAGISAKTFFFATQQGEKFKGTLQALIWPGT
jgi:hypothetical protein